MKKTITLSVIVSAIFVIASCQKEEIELLAPQAPSSCMSSRQHLNAAPVKGPALSLPVSRMAVINVVACRACHTITSFANGN